MIQPIFVHLHALFTVVAYHDPVPATPSERLPLAWLVPCWAKKKKAERPLAGNTPVHATEHSRFHSAGSLRSRPHLKSTRRPPWHC